MNNDAWGKLYDIATATGDIATITPGYHEGVVLLTWGNNDRAILYWHNGDWLWPEEDDSL